MEPCRNNDPEPGFLEFIRDRFTAAEASLFLTNNHCWRLCFGGSHLKFGVNPDMASLPRPWANGHPHRGGHRHEGGRCPARTILFISSTYWTESVGPVAALATLEKDVGGRP